MPKNIADLRISYTKDKLLRADLPSAPLAFFQKWFDDAVSADILEPNAMTLATVDEDGTPSARIVLLKGVDHGFRFYTNYTSAKGQALAANPKAALVFYWGETHRQIRIVGDVEKLTETESAEYFHSRPRGSQIGAWTSPQSQILDSRAVLEARNQEMTGQFGESDTIPLPPFWGGYRVVPHMIEFWQGRTSRLHDRFRYSKNGETWNIDRLGP